MTERRGRRRLRDVEALDVCHRQLASQRIKFITGGEVNEIGTSEEHKGEEVCAEAK